MNKRIFKPIMSLVLVVVMAVSTMSVSAVSTSAKTGNVKYSIEFKITVNKEVLENNMQIIVNGDTGSTNEHDVSWYTINKNPNFSFSDIDVGTIKSVTIKNGGRSWYPESIKVTKGGITTTIQCGKWVEENSEANFSVTDRTAKLTVKTANIIGMAGTDADVYLKLYDEKGVSTNDINLTEIHTGINAFENNDKESFIISVPDAFGTASKIDVRLYCGEKDSFQYLLCDGTADWQLDYIDVELDGVTIRFGKNLYINHEGIHSIYPIKYNYKITVKTSDKFLAGTDNQVYLFTYALDNRKIYGCNLDNNNDNFEKNDTDVFYISTPIKIDNIKVQNIANPLLGGDWHLDYIQLDLMDGNTVVESTKYNYQKWIKAFEPPYSPTSKKALDVK